MIGQLIVVVLGVLIVFILGMQSVWKSLRKKGHVRIDDWYYAAVKVKKGQYKRWE